jgi:hypothetical protein
MVTGAFMGFGTETFVLLMRFFFPDFWVDQAIKSGWEKK